MRVRVLGELHLPADAIGANMDNAVVWPGVQRGRECTVNSVVFCGVESWIGKRQREGFR